MEEDMDEQFEEVEEGRRVGEVAERFEAEEEGIFIRKIKDPRLPSEEEIERHNIGGHLDCRNWCEVCVRARSKDMPHRRDSGKERLLPEFGWDYCFLGTNWDTRGQY